MGADYSYGEMEPADIELMMQTAYLVLRDTGRRLHRDRQPVAEVPGDPRRREHPHLGQRQEAPIRP